jgi:DNA-directed RNA polymerase subunit alpha
MLDFQIPRITSESVEQNRGTFTIEPLDRGFGYTFGNSLRRVLLSSLAGAAVTSVRIEGVAHEFSTIQGVKEDVTDIVLNLKGVVCRMHSDASEVEAPLVVTGPGDITAKDIDLPAGVEILNPDLHIATLEKKTKLELYMTIGRGRGYRPAEENKSADQPIGVIPIDPSSRPSGASPTPSSRPASVRRPTSTSSRSTSRPTARSTRRQLCARPPSF